MSTEDQTVQDQTMIPPETQQQRWLKYGGNVVLVSVIVIALAALLIYISESNKLPRRLGRLDTTSGGLYSLKPQTQSVIRDNKQKITIISLYTKARQSQGGVDESAAETTGIAPIDKPAVVSDLLDEYRTQGSNITTEIVDPDLNPGKVEELIKDVMKNYGGEVDKYKTFIDSVPDKYTKMMQISDAEVGKIKSAFRESNTDEVDQSVALAMFSVQELPDMLKQGQKEYTKALQLKVPDYKRVTDSIGENMTALSQLLGKVIAGFNRGKDDKAVPTPMRDYMSASLPRYTELKKEADDLVVSEKGLGELKLDTLRDALKQKNPLLVRGEKEWRVIPYEKIWKTDTRSRGNGPMRPQFAGEQMITTAIISLNQPSKPKVCFVRAGGQPVAEGRLSSIADRLRDYNFEVSEKDLTGTWAMQAMQQQQTPAPEPSDADVDDAVWVVYIETAQGNPMMGGPPPSIAEKVNEHLEKGHHWANGSKADGGSAFVMFARTGDPSTPLDNLDGALTSFGIKARTDAMIVHPKVKFEGQADNNIVRIAPHVPYIFTYTEWGDHMITNPIQSLMGLLLAAVPIEVTHVDGVTSASLIPAPGAPNFPESWGETNMASLEEGPDSAGPKFDAKLDMAAPVYAGAAAEKKSGARVVCTGSGVSLVGATGRIDPGSTIVDMADQDVVEKKQMYTPQFPGSAEFFMNSVFWLSHQDSMIAISPSAMNISRIGEIHPVMLKFWHIGVLLIGLPGLVLVAGAMAYYSRQD